MGRDKNTIKQNKMHENIMHENGV